MKGQILGFDGETGAINGEDGQRYTFTAESWKDQRPPQARDKVDFVPSDGTAQDIYPIRGGGLSGTDIQDRLDRGGRVLQDSLAKASESGIGTLLVTRARAMPTAVIALFMLLVSILFTYARMGLGEEEIKGSLVGMAGAMGRLGELSGASLTQIQGMAGNMFSSETRALEAAAGMFSFSWFLYVIPILCVWILYRAYGDRRARIAELALGGFGILAGLYYWACREAIARSVDGAMFTSAELVRAQFSFGFGGWLIVLAGIAMVLTSLGIIKLRTDAVPALSGAE